VGLFAVTIGPGRVSHDEHLSVDVTPDRAVQIIVRALSEMDAKIVRADPLSVEAKSGRLRNAFYRSSSHWPIRIAIEIEPTERGSDAMVTLTDAMPFGTRIGSESSYMKGLIAVATTLRANVEAESGGRPG
jgi:hypothetical protein